MGVDGTGVSFCFVFLCFVYFLCFLCLVVVFVCACFVFVCVVLLFCGVFCVFPDGGPDPRPVDSHLKIPDMWV